MKNGISTATIRKGYNMDKTTDDLLYNPLTGEVLDIFTLEPVEEEQNEY